MDAKDLFYAVGLNHTAALPDKTVAVRFHGTSVTVVEGELVIILNND